jgi:predicted enzyme related to lactoylglutathione lyase
MSDDSDVNLGKVGWRDLTVPNAGEIRDFYKSVVGWESSEVEMGDYSDFNMISPGDGEAAAGICHARGNNAEIPPQWLIYIIVSDAAESATRCRELGGEVIVEPRAMGGGRFCVIRDPAGAVCALYQPTT